jgi:hypothetical protein
MLMFDKNQSPGWYREEYDKNIDTASGTTSVVLKDLDDKTLSTLHLKFPSYYGTPERIKSGNVAYTRK